MVREFIEQSFLSNTLFGNRIIDYCVCVLLFILCIVTVKIFELYLLKRLRTWAKKTATTIDDFVVGIIRHIALPLAYFGALYLSIRTLTLNSMLQKAINILGIALLTFFTVKLILASITYGLDIYWKRRGKDKTLERSLNGIIRVAKVIIWGLSIVFFLDNLGFKVSAVLAGLGIGGVAIALAAQAVLGDLFSYFSILFDRPFEIGDFIIVGEYLGTIDYIGIKTTRIRSLGGEQLVFSNTDLTSSRLRNYKRMDKRRVVFKFGVTYQTTLEQIKTIPGLVKNIIENINNTIFDRAHFSSYGDSSLIFEVVYYVLSSDYNKYMDTQQDINFSIKEQFEKQGIDFAYPTQTLYVNKIS